MKQFAEYISESQKALDAYWYLEEFFDEDTEEIIELLRLKDSPQILAFLKKASKEEQELKDQIDELQESIWNHDTDPKVKKLESEVDGIMSEYADYKKQYNIMARELEEYAGELQRKYSSYKETSWMKYEREIDKYLSDMNELGDKADALEKKAAEMLKERDALIAKSDAEWDEYCDKTNAEIDSIKKKLNALSEKNCAKLEKMRKDWEAENPIPDEFKKYISK